MELLKFIFSNGWIFAGSIIILVILISPFIILAEAVKIKCSKK